MASFESIQATVGKRLWVASSGGHLVQALEIARMIGDPADSIWLSNDVPQARSLLEGRRAYFHPYVAPRDVRGALSAARLALRIRRRHGVTQVVSTGAAIAGFAVPALALRGVDAIFVDSLTRVTSRSLTAKMVGAVPTVKRLTQSPELASRGWRFDGDVLGSEEEREADARVPEDKGLRIFVTLGTIRPYQFGRAVDAVLRLARGDDEIVWQLGCTDRDGLPGRVAREMPASEVARLIDWADVVVCHAGVGTILDVTRGGKKPVVVARDPEFGEHVDSHQLDLTRSLVRRSRVVQLDLGEPDRSVLLAAVGAAHGF
ncbi:glycosyltransferase [Demequina capsici]|uniref:Glycosyltransferase n=1 Tax=Demequina capsici TaxID=3075620 RepID=A0AA96J7Z9_9MICO|nr:glycosyltransferase [Demequina sp. OYTSA14]WNM24900.1 glycosyltransferase [Demequina sp. OYTSA14]